MTCGTRFLARLSCIMVGAALALACCHSLAARPKQRPA